MQPRLSLLVTVGTDGRGQRQHVLVTHEDHGGLAHYPPTFSVKLNDVTLLVAQVEVVFIVGSYAVLGYSDMHLHHCTIPLCHGVDSVESLLLSVSGRR
jgi:hypothetical protein